MDSIKFSIITVSKNSERYIEEAILSVAHQSFKNKEHIVIDGGSTDSTIDIIKRNNKYLTYWNSGPDNGIASAMNKGISKATGDYIIFINSDDYFVDNMVLENVSRYIDKSVDIYIFKVLYLYPNNRKLNSLTYPLGLLTNFKMGSCHQGQFISRNLFTKLGKYDENLNIFFDYDFILRSYRNGASSKSVNMLVSVMRQIGISSNRNWSGFSQRYKEEKIIHYKNCKNKMMFIFYKLYWLFYMPYRYSIYYFLLRNKNNATNFIK